jgi:hypothetical protein
MFGSAAFDSMFADVVKTLKPYLSDLVCIGGCANALYRYHENASDTSLPFLGTKDIDWASPQRIPEKNRKPLAELLIESGFEEEIFGADDLPVVKYVHKDEPQAGDIEFLCPRSGLPGARSKDGTSSSHPVQRGLMAQPLHYLELLQCRTWEIELGRIPEFVVLQGVRIRVPNPAAYVIQKVLISRQRRGVQSAAKDCYYIYEVSVVFRDFLDILAQESAALREKFEPWIRNFSRKAGKLFSGSDSEGPLSVLRVFNDAHASFGGSAGSLTPEMAWRSVEKLLVALNGK